MAMTPFASVDDLEAYWKPLTDAQQERAEVLFGIASNRLRLIAERTKVDLDNRSKDSEAYKATLNWIVMEAVKRALQTPVDLPAVETYAQTAGVYSENFKYLNPTGDLFFKAAELRDLGLSGGQTLGSITPITPERFYS